MKKIALVCQRYGLEVNGGAELLCRLFAEKLAGRYEVEVLTTCAVDYMTWANEYAPGETRINGVKVKRFAVKKQRDVRRFNKLSEKLFLSAAHTMAQERKWIDEQGPYCPELVAYIEKHHLEYRCVLFMTYLYYLSAMCLPKGMRNAVLIPTAHNEKPIYLAHYRDVFENAKGLIYNTYEEQEFVEKIFYTGGIPCVMAGCGIEIPPLPKAATAESLYGLHTYLVYAGRIDESKGCGLLFAYFQEYKKRNPGDLKLVLLGKPMMNIPDDPDIISLGFVSEEHKFVVMRDSVALVLASEYESLSIVVLESMALGRPVLVNGGCDVLRGHCVRSNAGLYFRCYYEFEGALRYLFSHPIEYDEMCKNAVRYVTANYRWEDIVERISELIETVGQCR